jgi:hypothetical protein
MKDVSTKRIIGGVFAVAIIAIAVGSWIVHPVPPGPAPIVHPIPSGLTPKLILDKEEVSVGEDYVLSVSALAGEPIVVQYSFNGGESQEMGATLDGSGAVKFNISDQTPKGRYRMLAFKSRHLPDWIPADASLIVK